MDKSVFDSGKSDAQATQVDVVKVSDFDFDLYREYTGKLTERCEKFMQASSGVLVYRRMRVAEVFSYGCRDMDQSLEWQLGALQKSMDYEADVPNFLEPWYGIGMTGASFGLDYIWHPGQAPAVKPAFQTIDEALAYDIKPVKDTAIGKHSLEMIEYFLEQTKGKTPISMGDIQSPFNSATNVVDTCNFLTSIILEPEKVLGFLDLLVNLEIGFYKEQEKLIGDALVRPGHGFASSFAFEGFGMSDDNAVMVDQASYLNCAAPAFEKLGNAFGGPVFHSCGNWSSLIPAVRTIKGLHCVDGAFSPETDPDPNPCEPFAEAFVHSGVVVNARIVGGPEVIEKYVHELWRPGMKLIVVTYCNTPEEQREAYCLIHDICQ